MQTNVYVDGWNLYYGAIKGTPYRWLDLHELSCCLLGRGYSIQTVKYFTARVDDRPGDPQQSQRQDIYLRALGANPQVEVHLGRFATRTRRVRLANRRPNGELTDEAIVTEEKGSDVKLATHLVWDAAHLAMQAALVISNDSDLQESLDMAMKLNVRVITCNPHDHHGQLGHLRGDETRNLRRRHMASAQFPQEVYGADGRAIRRPARWDP